MASRRSLPRGAQRGPQEGRFARVSRTARRVWPFALEAWRRWDRLPPHQKERYRKMASDYARRGRDAVGSRGGGRGRRR
jgi:hypothetical protein